MDPDYDGEDGALLWHVYYGELSEDKRFDAFRNKQLLNADVIKPFFGEEKLNQIKMAKVDRQVLFRQVEKGITDSRLGVDIETESVESHSVLIVLFIITVGIVYGLWYYRTQMETTKLVDPIEAETLLKRKAALEDEYIEV